jgi:hypothetical protein
MTTLGQDRVPSHNPYIFLQIVDSYSQVSDTFLKQQKTMSEMSPRQRTTLQCCGMPSLILLCRRSFWRTTLGRSLTNVLLLFVVVCLHYTSALSDTPKSTATTSSITSPASQNYPGEKRLRPSLLNVNIHIDESLLWIMGGAQDSDSSPENHFIQPALHNHQFSSNSYVDGFTSFSNSPQQSGEQQRMNPEHVFHECVQEHVDRWRASQMERQQNLTPEQEMNPRDEYGRAKLFQHVSKAARATIFLFFVFRDVHLIDLVDRQKCTHLFSSKRLILPLLSIMFIGNLAGAVVTFTSPSHSSKKRMKMILNGNKCVEIALILWNFLRLTINPTVHVPREVYLAGICHSLLFLLQAQTFTRLTWDENVAPPVRTSLRQASQTSKKLYDDISPLPWEKQQPPVSWYASNHVDSNGEYHGDQSESNRSY